MKEDEKKEDEKEEEKDGKKRENNYFLYDHDRIISTEAFTNNYKGYQF